jgi:integrase
MKVSGVKPADIEYGTNTERPEPAFFTKEQVYEIIGAAKEPFKTLFAIAWYTGMRAGELLALTVDEPTWTGSAALIRTWRDPPSRPSLQYASQGKYSPLRRESQRRFAHQIA